MRKKDRKKKQLGGGGKKIRKRGDEEPSEKGIRVTNGRRVHWWFTGRHGELQEEGREWGKRNIRNERGAKR